MSDMDDIDGQCLTRFPNLPIQQIVAYANQFYNETIFKNKSLELGEYSCWYHRYLQLTSIVNNWNGYINAVSCVLGFVSAILALMTLMQSEYNTRVSFFYHRLINSVELISFIFNISDAMASFSPSLMRYPIWAYWMGYVVHKIRNVLVVWINFIVLWLTIERAAACLAPDLFRIINKKSVAVSGTVVVGIVAFLIMFPDGFYRNPTWNDVNQMYTLNASQFGQSQGYKVYVKVSMGVLILSAIVHLGATMTAIAGFCKFLHKRRNMAFVSKRVSGPVRCGSVNQHGNNVDAQLCMLQLCESLPLVLNQLIYSVLKSIEIKSTFRTALYNAPNRMDFEEAMWQVHMAIVLQYIRVPNNMTAAAAHCCHFYWYVAFCPKYRRSFVQMIRKIRDAGKVYLREKMPGMRQ